MPTVELIYDRDCPNVAQARAQLLRAFAESKVEPRWQEWRGDDADSPSRVRGHGSPTILVEGRDVAGSGECGGQSCRLYSGEDGSLRGVPDVSVIANALREAEAASGGRASSGGWKINLAMLPGIGAAFLPISSRLRSGTAGRKNVRSRPAPRAWGAMNQQPKPPG